MLEFRDKIPAIGAISIGADDYVDSRAIEPSSKTSFRIKDHGDILVTGLRPRHRTLDISYEVAEEVRLTGAYCAHDNGVLRD